MPFLYTQLAKIKKSNINKYCQRRRGGRNVIIAARSINRHHRFRKQFITIRGCNNEIAHTL